MLEAGMRQMNAGSNIAPSDKHRDNVSTPQHGNGFTCTLSFCILLDGT